MKSDRLKSLMWLAVIGSWAFGFVVGRWYDSIPFIMEISKAVRVPNPTDLNAWWSIIGYFTFSAVSFFVLSHILFGVGGALFLFARGMYDSVIFALIERSVSEFSISSFSLLEIREVFIVSTVLFVNLPLCLWSSQLGMQRSFYTLDRLRGEPVNPKFGSEPISDLLKIITVSLVTGLALAVLLSYNM